MKFLFAVMMISKELLKSLNCKVAILLICISCISSSLFSQKDTTQTTVIETERGQVSGKVKKAIDKPEEYELEKLHSPKKATILSAVLPGAGQIYNKKYWKAPIVWGGLALSGYYLSDNLSQLNRYRDAYVAETDGDSGTINDTGFGQTQLLDLIDTYKTWRDWSYIAIGAVYILNIIDASVDAHLFYFDVSDDISMNLAPYFNPFANRSAGVSLMLKL